MNKMNNIKSLNDASFRSDYKDIKTKNPKSSVEWSHKEICLKHIIRPVMNKHFGHIPRGVTDFCTCNSTKEVVSNEYEKIGRISLLCALEKYHNSLTLTKPAKLCDFSINVDDINYKIDILKIKAGAIKRYTQPRTEKELIGTGAFFDTSIYWKLNETYFIEIRLKKKHSKQKISIDLKRKSNDIAVWWFNCYAVYGITEYTKKDGHGSFIDIDGIINHNGMRLKPYIAIHHNDFVGGGDLRKSLNRIILILHKKKRKYQSSFDSFHGKTKFKINNKMVPLLNEQKIKIENDINSNNKNNRKRNNNNNNIEREERKNENEISLSLKMENIALKQQIIDIHKKIKNESTHHITEQNQISLSLKIENITLKQHIVDIEHETFNLKQENETLLQRISYLELQQKQKMEDSIQIKIEPKNDNIMQSLQHKIMSLEQENDDLSNELKEIQHFNSFYGFTPQPIFNGIDGINGINGINDNFYRNQEEEINKLKRDINELNKEVQILTNENERITAVYKNGIMRYQTAYIHGMRIKIAENMKLQNQIDRLRYELVINGNNSPSNQSLQEPSPKRQRLNNGTYAIPNIFNI